MRIRSIIIPATVLALAAAIFSGQGNAAQDLPAGHPPLTKFSTVQEIVKEKCMSCHTRDFELPFYARIPGIKQIIEKDYKDGFRAMNLNSEFDPKAISGPVSEVTISKMEWVLENNTMPPPKFTAVHWGSRLTAEERQAIIDWIRVSRAAHYATGTASAKHANEPLQPLPDSIPVNAQKAALGQKLFNDKRLSGDNTLSCASCHVQNKGYTDNLRFAEGVRKQFGDINAPTVLNSVFNIKQFWNGRAADLMEQAGGPPFNPVEMDSKDWNQVIAKLEKDDALVAEIKAVYPSGLSGENITDAIAEYEKTLITPNSRFDQWLKGKDNALTKLELDGYQRFKAYRCASCHVGKTVGGQSFEFMNLKKDYFAERGFPLSSDEGLKAFTKNADDLHKFKAPNLRNIELTWPYMHDGTVKTMDEAVRIMGIYLSGMDIPEMDRTLIVAFLRTLTGEYLGAPVEGKAIGK